MIHNANTSQPAKAQRHIRSTALSTSEWHSGWDGILGEQNKKKGLKNDTSLQQRGVGTGKQESFDQHEPAPVISVND